MQWIWEAAGELDANPSRNGLKAQVMGRKSDAMHDLLDAMVAGRLRRVDKAAAEIEANADGIDEFLSTDMYDEYGVEFFAALKDLRGAAQADDHEGAKEATLRLERACIDCHSQLDQPASVERWR